MAKRRCPVCGKETCRSHPHTGPLPRALGGERALHGPVEDRAKKAGEDR